MGTFGGGGDIVATTCEHLRTKVNETRAALKGLGPGFSIVRERECLDCGLVRFTREILDNTALDDLNRIWYRRYGKRRVQQSVVSTLDSVVA
jgi:transcriptional regulator NrdR family protein